MRQRIFSEILLILLVFLIVAPRFYFSQLKKAGDFSTGYLRITIPEGFNNRQIADKLKKFPNFNSENFLELAKDKEGYLFPDTYFFTGRENEEKIIASMETNFEKKVLPILDAAEAEKKLPEIIIMASLLEKEAITIEDRKIISGILWKRLNAGMLLQVDASLVYLTGKTSKELTADDLKTDSPYNTYKKNGLPVAPIANPGMESIKSALEPEESAFWFYLSDKNGKIHYAKNFEEHKINKTKFIR